MRNAEQRQDIFGSELKSAPERLHVLSLDVERPEERKAVVEYLSLHSHHRLDCLINNAGFGLFGALEDLDQDQVRKQFEVNYFGLLFLTQAVLPMLRNARGRIIQLSSVLGTTGAPLTSQYCAGKFALEGFSESLAMELAPFGVQVCVVGPGAHRTQFGRNILWGRRSGTADSPYKQDTERYQATLQRMLDDDGAESRSVVLRIAELLERRHLPPRVACGWDAQAIGFLRRVLPRTVYQTLALRVSRSLYFRKS
jgi:NAD(P)-dependent dehydrogenase (short-subunit alcohol dehydrogenase family)